MGSEVDPDVEALKAEIAKLQKGKAMPRKRRYLSHNINTHPPHNETSNNLQSPWFPFTYASQIDGDQNSSRNTSSGHCSASSSTSQDSLLQPKTDGRTTKPVAVVQNVAEKDQNNARNVRPCVHLQGSQYDLPNDASTYAKLPTNSKGKMHIENYFAKAKNLNRKKKPADVDKGDVHKNESVARNIRQCLESHGICHDQGEPRHTLHTNNTSSIIQSHCATGASEVQMDHHDKDAEMTPSAHHTSKQYETDCVPNVHDILHNVGTQNPGPSSHRKRPFSGQSIPIMAHEATHGPDSASDVSEHQQICQNRTHKRLRQQSRQTTRRNTGGRTHNVRQRLRADNLANTYSSPPPLPVQGPSVLPDPDTTPSYEDLGDCDQRRRHCVS